MAKLTKSESDAAFGEALAWAKRWTPEEDTARFAAIADMNLMVVRVVLTWISRSRRFREVGSYDPKEDAKRGPSSDVDLTLAEAREAADRLAAVLKRLTESVAAETPPPLRVVDGDVTGDC